MQKGIIFDCEAVNKAIGNSMIQKEVFELEIMDKLMLTTILIEDRGTPGIRMALFTNETKLCKFFFFSSYYKLKLNFSLQVLRESPPE